MSDFYDSIIPGRSAVSGRRRSAMRRGGCRAAEIAG